MLDDGSPWQQSLAAFGSIIAGAFLICVGLANLSSVRGLIRALRQISADGLDEVALERHLSRRGFMVRTLGRRMRHVGKPCHM